MTSNSQNTLSPIWQKAVVIGTFWGALEIVLGSVLHNLMLPLLAGTLLSFAGVMIMTAISVKQPQRGLYWRAALVCAMLKSVSPSAVIITPMIAIMLEGLLVELGILLMGRNLVGLAIGGGLAVLSVPAFKITRLFMMYGSSIYDLYLSVFKIENQSDIPNYWPVVGVSLVYILIGVFAVILGYSIGRNLKIDRWSLPELDSYNTMDSSNSRSLLPIVYFTMHLSFLAIFLSFTSKMPTLISLLIATSYIVFTLFFYPRARFPFKKLSLLIPVILFSFVVPIISVGSIYNIVWIESGAKIMMRAFLVVVSFAAIGTELGKPSIKGFFSGGFFQPAYMATSLAFNALPEFMGRIKEFELRGGNPISQIRNLVSDTLTPVESGVKNYPVILIVGERGEGKTTFVKMLVDKLASAKVKFTGFYALGEGDSNLRIGYRLVLLPENKSLMLSQRIAQCGTPQKSFEFDTNALAEGEKKLLNAKFGEVIVIDEIGRMELEGGVWADAFTKAIQRKNNPMIVTVRKVNVESFIQKWNIQNPIIVDIKTGNINDILTVL
ncbi:MAG: nucleoside-triphosphatase [Bacteroidales bacterium]